MRVLIINKFLYPNGGSETYIFKLGEALEQHGHEVQYFGIPKNLFPTMLNVGTKIWGSFDLSDADACKALAHTDIPLLIIHGDEDMQAPLSMAYKLYDSCNGEKQLYIVHGADHAENYRKDLGGYEKIVTKFIEECIERKDD